MIGFTPFKGRTAMHRAVYDVYRNLNAQKRTGKVVWSIRDTSGRVVGHAESVTLADALPYVNGIAQQRIAAGAPREVHAWVRGRLISDPVWTPYDNQQVTYKPHTHPWFFYVSDGTVWNGSPVVTFNERGMFA